MRAQGTIASKRFVTRRKSDPRVELGYDAERMDDLRRLIDAPNSDVFDVLAYIRFAFTEIQSYLFK